MRVFSRTPTNACGYMICKYMDRKDSAAMLSADRWPGVTPEVNQRNPLQPGEKACKWELPPWLQNPGQMSPEVQNRDISGPTKRIHVLQIFFNLSIFSGTTLSKISSQRVQKGHTKTWGTPILTTVHSKRAVLVKMVLYWNG